MKEIHIRCEWVSDHVVEVPDDYEWSGGLDDEWADQLTPQRAEIFSWEQR